MAALADNWDDESEDDWEKDASDDNEDVGDEEAGKEEEENLTAQQSLKNMIDAFDIEARRSFRTGEYNHFSSMACSSMLTSISLSYS